jgi:hypothetical protein
MRFGFVVVVMTLSYKILGVKLHFTVPKTADKVS